MQMYTSMSMSMPPQKMTTTTNAPTAAPTSNPTDATFILTPGIQTSGPTASPVSETTLNANTCQGTAATIQIPLEVDTTMDVAAGNTDSLLDLISSTLESVLLSEYKFCTKGDNTASTVNSLARGRRHLDDAGGRIQLESVQLKNDTSGT